MLTFPLYQGFFPQMVLTVDELMHYRRFGKERVGQLVRIIEDADCIYQWSDVKTKSGRHCQKTQFLDIRPSTKASSASTLLKSSVHIVDVEPEEILQAIAKVKTRDYRRTMKYMYGDQFVDGQALMTFPTSSSSNRPGYSYRAIKWCALKGKRPQDQKHLDFCFLEYAGSKKPRPGTSVLGFCVQESISRDREVPSLEQYGIVRGWFMRTGIIITKTHQSNILNVTSIVQIDGALPSTLRHMQEEMLLEYVASIHKVKGLLERQRMGRLQYLEEWDWVAPADRKACAVCLRGFYFHRKHHCQTCGEVVCSSCAPLRELEEPLSDITQLRVCSLCMAAAGSSQDRTSSSVDQCDETTSNAGTDTYIQGLRYPRHKSSNEAVISNFRHNRRTGDSLLTSNDSSSKESVPMMGERYRSSVASTPAEKKQALSRLVDHIRQIRDTIDVAISDAGEANHMVVDSERYDDIYERIIKIRETLDLSGSEFDAVLADVGGSIPYSESNSERGTDFDSNPMDDRSVTSDQPSHSYPSPPLYEYGRKRVSDRTRYSPNPADGDSSAHDTDDNKSIDSLALEKALQWASESHQDYASPVKSVSKIVDNYDTQNVRPPQVLTINKNRGIERLSQKIGRLQKRLEASEHAVQELDDLESEPEPDRSRKQSSVKQVEMATPPRALRLSDTSNSKITSEMVANLRGVMNSSELTKPPMRRLSNAQGSVRGSIGKRDPPPPPPTTAPTIPPFTKQRESFPPPKPLSGTTIYIYDENRINKFQRLSLEKSDPRDDMHLSSSDDEPLSLENAGDAYFSQSDDGDSVEEMPQAHPTWRKYRNGKDESDELRELMHGLAKEPRSRCSSGQSSGAPSQEKFDF